MRQPHDVFRHRLIEAAKGSLTIPQINAVLHAAGELVNEEIRSQAIREGIQTGVIDDAHKTLHAIHFALNPATTHPDVLLRRAMVVGQWAAAAVEDLDARYDVFERDVPEGVGS